MSEQQAVFLQKGLIATCAVAALILFVSFYSVVSSAVHRAAQQRLAGAGVVSHQPAAPTKQRAAARDGALLAGAAH